MGKMGEQFEVSGGAAIALLCARCKESVRAGETHVCKFKEEDNESTEKAAVATEQAE